MRSCGQIVAERQVEHGASNTEPWGTEITSTIAKFPHTSDVGAAKLVEVVLPESLCLMELGAHCAENAPRSTNSEKPAKFVDLRFFLVVFSLFFRIFLVDFCVDRRLTTGDLVLPENLKNLRKITVKKS